MAYKHFYLLLLFSCCSAAVYGQNCNNPGPNLFPDGSFGTGNELVAPDTPYVAPFWYTYTLAPPLPFDAYTITNNTAPWAASENWITTMDNSADPEGYMMVVNATQNATVFWVRNLELCGEVSYQFSFDAINLQDPGAAPAPQPELQWYVNSELSGDFGNLAQDGQWHSFVETITIPAGSSGNFLFELFNRNPGAAGNDFAIDNLVLSLCGPETTIMGNFTGPLCPGDPATFQANIGPGFDDPVIQWQFSTDGGATWQQAGAPGTTTTFTIPLALPGTLVRALVAETEPALDNENCRVASNEIEPAFLDINDCFEIPVTIEGGICGGQYGDNIFPEGDFGTGPSVFGPELPPGTTNMAFQNTTWPNDGFYALMNFWDEDICNGGLPAPCWILPIVDNSVDPQGYGMVVNATEGETGIFYTATIDGLCENTTYQFTADIINLNTRWFAPFNANNPDNVVILPNIDFIIGPTGTPFELMQIAPEVYRTGDILNDSTWNSYGFSFTTLPGVSSITFALRNNAPGGGGNDFILDNISFRMCGQADVSREPLCAGQAATLEALFDNALFPTPALQWQYSADSGLTWSDLAGETGTTLSVPSPTAGGQYRYLLAGSQENLDSTFCRLTSRVDTIVFLPQLTGNATGAICDGAAFLIGDSTFTQTGTYDVYFTAANGCDSIVSLVLALNPTYEFNRRDTICEGSAFFFEGQELSLPGDYQQPYLTTEGCDSIINLSLSVLPVSRVALVEEICEGGSYSFGGQQLTEEGMYEHIEMASNGCDSIITLDLIVRSELSVEINAAICEGEVYSFDGQELAVAGTYQAVYQSQYGCDSTVHLSLAVLPVLRDTILDEICQGDVYLFDGQSLTEPGTYESVEGSSNGCDSVTTLQLTVRPTEESMIFQSICEGEGYPFDGQELTVSGTYQATYATVFGCDSLVALMLEVLPLETTTLATAICEGESYFFGGQPLSQAGAYEQVVTGSNGCDSTISLELSVLPNYAEQEAVSLCRGEFFAGLPILSDTTIRFEGQTTAGCDSIITYTIIVEELPGFEIEGARPLCNDFTARLRAGSFASYLWSDGSTLPELEVSLPGWYSATVTNQQGCTAVDSVLIESGAFTPELDVSGPICEGENSGGISVTNIQGGTSPFLYSFDEGPFLENSIYNDLPAGIYNLSIQDAIGCEWAEAIQLTNPPPVLASISGRLEISLGDSTQLNVLSLGNSLVRFDWQPSDGLSCSDCPNPVASPNQTTYYMVLVEDADGCPGLLEVEIRVEDSRKLFFPNAFSPNEDGRNDVFTLYPSKGIARIIGFQIYNRWGATVFDAQWDGTGPLPSWDGQFNGALMNPAVFTWWAEVEFVDGAVRLYEGELSLLR